MKNVEFKIKCLSDAAGKNIRSLGNYKPYEKYKNRNHALMRTAFNKLVNGEIDAIIFDNGVHFDCIHRSTRDGILVQHSYGFYRDGVFYAEFHDNINSYEELNQKGYRSGTWNAVKVA